MALVIFFVAILQLFYYNWSVLSVLIIGNGARHPASKVSSSWRLEFRPLPWSPWSERWIESSGLVALLGTWSLLCWWPKWRPCSVLRCWSSATGAPGQLLMELSTGDWICLKLWSMTQLVEIVLYKVRSQQPVDGQEEAVEQHFIAVFWPYRLYIKVLWIFLNIKTKKISNSFELGN